MAQLPDGEAIPDTGVLPPGLECEGTFSFYIHIPFCRSRCGYCDFNTYTPGETSMSLASYLEAAKTELDLVRRALGRKRVSTIFFGGGTPTMLASEQLISLLDAIRDRFDLEPEVEITTEANPETVDAQYLEQLYRAGFTRLSLGMQSVAKHVLAVLDRKHDPKRALEVVHWAHAAGFNHINLDLIYGTPGESLADWQASLEAVSSCPVDHVSAYSLIVEEGTRLAVQVRKGLIAMPEEDDLADKYLMADHYLSDLGFHNYETSNWAKPGGECRHNLVYWKSNNWWGIGPGAHSHISGVRFWNHKHPRSYVEALRGGESPALARELLSDDDRRRERILLELRLAEGLELSVLKPAELHRAKQMAHDALVSITGDRLIVKQPLLADGIIRDLLE